MPKQLKPAEFPPLARAAVTASATGMRFGTPFPMHWNVSRRHAPYFTGRDSQIDQIFHAFVAQDAAHIPGPQAIVGLGGLGKTQTAAEYAYRYREHYEAVLWVRADSRANLSADYQALTELLHLPEPNDPLKAMQTWFTAQSNWLLILDNADDLPIIEDFLPHAQRGHVLLTTRVRAATTVGQPFLLEALNPEDGALCILRRAGSIALNGYPEMTFPAARIEAAIRISTLMDGLPLALEQAGAYIEDTGTSESRYLSIYEKHRAEVIKRQYGALPNYPLAVATVWDISRNIVKRREPATFDLLQLCAFLAPDAIPREVFTRGAALGPELQAFAADDFALDIAIATLRRYSLLNREVNKDETIDRFSIHRMVQEMLRDEMDEKTAQSWAERAVQAVFLSLHAEEKHIIETQVRHCLPLINQWHMTFPEAEGIQRYAEEIEVLE